MYSFYDQRAPKKATNLSVNSDFLRKIKEINVNLSATLEIALKGTLRKNNEEKWLNENAKAIEAYNNFIEENGCFGDDIRSF